MDLEEISSTSRETKITNLPGVESLLETQQASYQLSAILVFRPGVCKLILIDRLPQ